MADRKPWEMTDELPEKALLVRLIALVDEWDEQPSGEALLCGKQAVIDFLHGDDVRLVIAESIKELREELQSVLSDWNSLVAAIGSPHEWRGYRLCEATARSERHQQGGVRDCTATVRSRRAGNWRDDGRAG